MLPFELEEATTVITISGKVMAEGRTFEVTQPVVSNVPSEDLIPDFITRAFKYAFGVLPRKVRHGLNGQQSGVARLEMNAELSIGVLKATVKGYASGEFPLASLSTALANAGEVGKSLFLLAIDEATSTGIHWDSSRCTFTSTPRYEYYGFPGGDDLVGLDGLIELLSRAGGDRVYLSRGFGSRDSGLFGSGFDDLLSAFLTQRPKQSEPSKVQEGYYGCPICEGSHPIGAAVAILQAALKDGKRIPRNITEFVPIVVLHALARAEGGYWEATTATVKPIPYNQYPHAEGGLTPLPDGKFFSRETWEVADIPEGMYLTPDGLAEFPEGTKSA